MKSSGHLTKLVELAGEKSSSKRRTLLRDLTDLFLDDPNLRSGEAGAHADAILSDVAAEMEDAVRAELAERFADAPDAPLGLIRQLAHDAFSVARPVLERSTVLDDDTLTSVATQNGVEHVRAIAARPEVSETVADAVAARGDVDALSTLVQNPGADLSRDTYEIITDAAQTEPSLHAPLVDRTGTPPDLLNELFFVVEHELRARIEERNANLDPDVLDAALNAARARLRANAGPTPSDIEDAERYVSNKKLRKALNGDLLISLLDQGEITKFTVAFADLAEIDFLAADKVVTHASVDPLAIACRAAKFERDTFVSLALLRPTADRRGTADPNVLGEIYDALPEDASDRVMRFWRVRRDNGECAA